MSYTKTSHDERVKILAATSAFHFVKGAILEIMANRFKDVSCRSGHVVVTEGEDANGLFVIVEGRTQVSELCEGKEVLLATLEKGELFGEMAFFDKLQKRQATVRAITDLKLLFLDCEALKELLTTHEEVLNSVKEIAETRMKVSFLKRFSPFESLSPGKIQALFSNLEKRFVGLDTIVVRQGELAEECYLIISGKMEVLLSENERSMRRVATLYPGSIVGEAALLTDEPRGATIRTLEDCELLIIRRDTLLEILKEDSQVKQNFLTVLRRRSRPKRVDNIIVQKQKTNDGDPLWILKNPEIGTYVRLSSEGWFIWERLDGEHSIKDLALDFMREWKIVSPEKITEIISKLARSGFIFDEPLSPDVMALATQSSFQQRILKIARHATEYNLIWKCADPFFSFLYRICRFLFLRPIQGILAIVSVGGLVIFFMMASSVLPVLEDPTRSRSTLIFLIPAILVSMVIHELGHGITTKHFRREVRAAGIGWYWFSPIAFVDTTDMWTAGKWPRVGVSIAGPYANFILAGVASYIAWILSSQIISASLWQFAFVSYIGVLMNLHPLLEYDGYFILSDLLDRPNLRSRSFEWLGKFVLGNVNRRMTLYHHRFDFLYGISSIIYIAVMAYIFVISYRIVLEVHLRSLLPVSIAAVLPWLIVSAIVISTGITTIGNMNIFPRRTM